MMIHHASIVDGFRLPAVPHSTAKDISISGIPIMPISFSRVSRQGWKTSLHRDNHVLSKTAGVEPASRPEKMKKPLLLPIKLRFAPVCKQPYACTPHFKRSCICHPPITERGKQIKPRVDFHNAVCVQWDTHTSRHLNVLSEQTPPNRLSRFLTE